jgi:ATP-dependent Lhr-like helicase
MLETAGIDRQTFNQRWWQEVWSGALTSDSLSPLSQGLLQKFEMPSLSQNTSSRRRMARHPRGWSGLWHLTPQAAAPDPLTALENDKERVRLMLDRYGFLCRELVNRESLKTEAGKWRWRDAFRALRIMELSGEVIAGQFFLDLATPQFISPNALSQLQSNTTMKDSFWVATQDPVAPCGLGLPWSDLPHRRSGNYLSFFDGQLALSITGSGKHLAYAVPSDHPAIDAVNGVLTHMVSNSRQRIVVQDINELPARQSPFIGTLERLFTVGVDHKSIFLELKR